MFSSRTGNSIGIHIALSNYLELCEMARLSFLNKVSYSGVARALIHKLQIQGIDVKQYSFDDDYQIYRLCSYLFSKRMLVVPAIEHNVPEAYEQYSILQNNFFNGGIVKSIDIASNYFAMHMQDDTCYVEYSKNILAHVGREPLELHHLAQFVKIEQVKKYAMNSQNFFYLTQSNELRVRFSGHLLSPKSEQDMPIVLNAYQFKENQVDIVDFYLTDNFVVIRSASENLYLIDCIHALKPEKLASKDFLIFKIDFNNTVKEISLSNSHMFILGSDSVLFQVCFVKGQLLELTNRYNTSKLVEHLILKPEPCKVMNNKLIRKIYTNHRNLFIFEEQMQCKQIEDFTVAEVQEFLKNIQIKCVDKIILHNNINGARLIEMTEQEIERVLGLKCKSLSSCRLMDELNIRKSLVRQKPRLYVFGSNNKRQFNISDHLNYLVEIDAPNMDVNEQIKDVIIGIYNTIITTDKNRSFISVNNIPEATRRRLSSEYGDAVENPKDKGKKRKQQNKRKPKPKGPQEDIKKFEWLDFNDIICKYQKKLSKNVDITQIVSQGKNFYVLFGEHVLNKKDHLKYFEHVNDWLDFVKRHKNFDKDDILFFHTKDKSYYDYKQMLTKSSIMNNIKLVKKKSNNQILWSLADKYFDVKSNI